MPSVFSNLKIGDNFVLTISFDQINIPLINRLDDNNKKAYQLVVQLRDECLPLASLSEFQKIIDVIGRQVRSRGTIN